MRGSYLTVAITLTCFQCDEELAFQLAAHAQFFVEAHAVAEGFNFADKCLASSNGGNNNNNGPGKLRALFCS